jgi:hypothetical protein
VKGRVSATRAAESRRSAAELEQHVLDVATHRARELGDRLGVRPERLMRGRLHCTAHERLGRNLLAYILCRVDGVPCTAVARLAGTTHPAIIKRVRRAEALLEEDAKQRAALLPAGSVP